MIDKDKFYQTTMCAKKDKELEEVEALKDLLAQVRIECLRPNNLLRSSLS